MVFSAECRKGVQEENPEMSFGEISKLVGLKVGVMCVYREGFIVLIVEQLCQRFTSRFAFYLIMVQVSFS